MSKPYKYSYKQWNAKKYCNFKCWGKHQISIGVLKGKPALFKGHKHTAEAKEKDRLAHLGNKSSFYKDGRASNNYKEYYNLKGLERYARKKGAEGTFSLEDWNQLLCKHEYKCVHCGRSDIKLTKDHVIPLSRGGSNWINNIQPLCQPCNSSKNNRLG